MVWSSWSSVLDLGVISTGMFSCGRRRRRWQNGGLGDQDGVRVGRRPSSFVRIVGVDVKVASRVRRRSCRVQVAVAS